MHTTNIRLNLILERFSYPITEEQTWGICYLTACDLKSLPGPWIYTPNDINRSMCSDNCDRDSDELPMESVLLNKTGELKIDRKILSSRFANFDSGTRYISTLYNLPSIQMLYFSYSIAPPVQLTATLTAAASSAPAWLAMLRNMT